MLQTPGVSEFLATIRYHTVRHGILIVVLIVQGAQQACGASKVPTAHIEPTDIELYIAVQTEQGVRYDGQYVQFTIDANIAQFDGQHGLQIAIDYDLLCMIRIAN